jgi:mannan endo-1,4-beta-mannosidase
VKWSIAFWEKHIMCLAIWGSRFRVHETWKIDAITHRDLLIEEAKRQYAAGSVIYLCWHMLRPTEDEPGQPGES